MSEGSATFAVNWPCAYCYGTSSGCTGACQPSLPHQIGVAAPQPKGCICPPTSEKTCQRWDCGRKSATGVTVRSGTARPHPHKGT